MSTELDRAVELLDRSLGYTRVVLADVTDHQLDHPTPCAGWSLKDLLRHMEDALDAFTEAAGGVVEVPGPGPATTGGGALQEKACALLGAWSRAEPTAVAVGDLELASPVLVAAAALEITVHGWDVGQATGHGGRIPEDLARDLLPVAGRLVDPADRGVRFARPRPTAAEAPYDARLLAFLGRHLTGPPGRVRGNRDTARAWLPSLALMQAPEVADLLSDPPGDTAPPSAPRPRALLHSGLARAWEQARLGQVNAALAALAALRLTGEIDPDSTDAVLLLATSIDCRLARGDLGDALALSEELAPYLEQPGARGAIAHHARGEVASALNEPDLAALHFTTAGQRVAADIGYADLVPWRAGAALAAVRLRRRPEAAALARDQLALAGGSPYASALALRTLATTDAGGDRVALLRRARAALSEAGAGRLAAQIDTDLAGLLLLAGDAPARAEALALLRNAEEYAGRQELWPLQSRVRRLLDLLGESPLRVESEALAALTASERRVARLAAGGLTNRQIAEELFVTVKAVEWHLSHVYRKLGIRSRTRLSHTLGVAG